MRPATVDDPRLASQVLPVERPAGTVTVALRPESVRAAIEGLDRLGADAAPTFRRLLDESEPYTVGKASGHLLRDVPVAELRLAYDEVYECWSQVDEHERLFFHVIGVVVPLARALRLDPLAPRIETSFNHSYAHPERQAGYRHARWRARAQRHVMMCALADRLTVAVRNGPPQVLWTRSAAWRLLGEATRPSRMYEGLPAGAYLFHPVPLHLRIEPVHPAGGRAAPAEPEADVEARVHAALESMTHVHTVVGLASSGYATAQQGVTWLVGFVAECLCEVGASDVERRAAWATAHAAVARFVSA